VIEINLATEKCSADALFLVVAELLVNLLFVCNRQ